LPSLLEQKKKQEGDDIFAVIAFFVIAKPKQKAMAAKLPTPSSLQQKQKKEGDDSFVAVAFFITTKLKREGLNGGSLPSSSRFGSCFKLSPGSHFRHSRTLAMEFVGLLQACCRGSGSNCSRALAME
jgi:hypothetical protein